MNIYKFNDMMMIKRFVLLLFAGILCSCGEDIQVYQSEPSITITTTTPDNSGEQTIVITPEENAVRYTYALVVKADFNTNDLLQGRIENQVQVKGNSQTEVSLADTGDADCVVAVAFGENGISGPVAVNSIRAMQNNIQFASTFLTDCSLGIRFSWPAEYAKCVYHLGRRSDRDAFIKGELVDSTLYDLSRTFFHINAFDLEPSSEYVLFARGWDRKGALMETREYAVTTLAANSCPKVDMQVDYVDVYKADLTFKANDQTYAIITMPSWAAPEQGISVRNGDILDAMHSYIAQVLWGRMATEGREQQRTENNSMYVDSTKYFYVEALDAEGRSYLYRQSYKTPAYNEHAVSGNISINVADITTYGATYEFTCDKNVFAFLCGTIDADWYDALKTTPAWHEFYLHEYLWQTGGRLIYKDDLMNGGVYLLKETRQTAGKRVYVAACPMNENGYKNGFLPPVLKEYVTATRQ